MFPDLETLKQQIHLHLLDAYEQSILAAVRPGIQMRLTPVNEDELPLGTSKLGGNPDLPPGFQWKYKDEKPLTFIGQFRLSELAVHEAASVLPPHGMLYYFYEASEQQWIDYQNPEFWQVVFLETEDIPYTRVTHPSHDGGDYSPVEARPAHCIHFTSGLWLPFEHTDAGLPHWASGEVKSDNPSERLDNWTMYRRYNGLLDRRNPEPRHHFFGHPWTLQDDCLWGIVIDKYQIKPNKSYAYAPEQTSFIKAEVYKWQFLFQIDTDKRLDFMWGDCGTLYICIPKESLAARRFEDCVTVAECL